MLKNCLVLKLQDFGENSLIVTLLHSQLGKVECLAKGGKNIGAKLTPFLQPSSLVNLWLAPAKGSLPTIREVEAARSYLPLGDYFGLKFSLHVLALLEKVTHPSLECRDLMRSTLEILKVVLRPRLPIADLKKLWIQFELCVLSHLGIKPDTKTIRAHNLDALAHILEKRIHQNYG
ncbi:MAG: recombination protein O N-terminal domain-containing protein [Candidatus Portnoybacteria bacterium]|nr:recombination protein O N-terminal domain-containing protein [Candidatus Portnoybacteria bacterium]